MDSGAGRKNSAFNDGPIFSLCVVGWVVLSLWAIGTGHIGSLREAAICAEIGAASFVLGLVFRSSFEAKRVFRAIPFLALSAYAR